MKAFKRMPLFLAAALLVAQPAMACCCLDDLAAKTPVPVSEAPCCNDSTEGQDQDSDCTNPSQCPDCTDLEPAPLSGSMEALAAQNEICLKLPPASADQASVSFSPQIVRIIGPPPPFARPPQTPVDLKQRLLF